VLQAPLVDLDFGKPSATDSLLLREANPTFDPVTVGAFPHLSFVDHKLDGLVDFQTAP
jgi:hypothetical protein